jgi:predicted nucleotidyltransferase
VRKLHYGKAKGNPFSKILKPLNRLRGVLVKDRITQKRWRLDSLVTAFKRELSASLWGLVLFGSVAREEEDQLSDIDLLIVADGLPEKSTTRTTLIRSKTDSELEDAMKTLLKAFS